MSLYTFSTLVMCPFCRLGCQKLMWKSEVVKVGINEVKRSENLDAYSWNDEVERRCRKLRGRSKFVFLNWNEHYQSMSRKQPPKKGVTISEKMALSPGRLSYNKCCWREPVQTLQGLLQAWNYINYCKQIIFNIFLLPGKLFVMQLLLAKINLWPLFKTKWLQKIGK